MQETHHISDFSLSVPFLKPTKVNEKIFDNSHEIWIEPLLIHMHIQEYFHSITSPGFIIPKSPEKPLGKRMVFDEEWAWYELWQRTPVSIHTSSLQQHKQYPQKLLKPFLICIARAYVKLGQEEIGIQSSQRAYCLSKKEHMHAL